MRSRLYRTAFIGVEVTGTFCRGEAANDFDPCADLRDIGIERGTLDHRVRRFDNQFHIGFGDIGGDASLSPAGDLGEAAARLYALLHRAAASEKPRIAVAPVPESGIGIAINDRLRRAAN